VTGRSFRTRYDGDCVPWGAPPGTAASIRGTVRRREANGGDSCRLAVTITSGAKLVRIDDRPLARLARLWGRLHAVLFSPDDLQLIKGGPGERRRYLDVALGQIDSRFLFHLQRYGRALRQRNALLKQSDRRSDRLRAEAAPWDAQLVEHGLEILRARFHFLRDLEPRTADIHSRIAREGGGQGAKYGETLRLRYANFLRQDAPPEGEESARQFRELLHASLEEDLRRGQTSVGPHRDDFSVHLSGKTARDFASQGQIRSCVLALRLAEVFEMQARTGDFPLLLLDDLASELDAARKERVLALVDPAWQTFLTTTRREDFPADSTFATVIRLPV
ncbi:MAG TPA: DNA replication and repair protein RecF, partial [Sumerlaeia bacterium]|nr:DNA replication and repair protein RecF [Sumerlaeia bacterium]